MKTTRTAGEDDDAFDLRLSWDRADGESVAAEEPSTDAQPGRRRREDDQNGSPPLWSPEVQGPRAGAPAEPLVGSAVHDLVNRVELRHIGVALGDVRGELADLRTALADVPPAQPALTLQPVLDEIGDVRGELADLRTALADVATQWRLAAAHTAEIPPPPPAVTLQPVLDELGALRGELIALKRRIAVRASADVGAAGEQADEIATLVAERLAVRPPDPSA